MSSIIETHNLSKTYSTNFGRHRVSALNEVSFQVQQGEVFALLGLNGAGKSTLIKTVLDLVRPTSGQAFLFGEPVRSAAWKRRVGYLPELFSAPKFMNAQQVLRYLGELSGLKGKNLVGRIDETLQKVGLSDASNQKTNSFSKGMVLRLGIAQALLHQPELLLLDEPTEGLDPLGRKIIRNLLTELSSKGVTILLNSHLLSEVELVAHRIAILHKGRLVAQGKLTDLLPQDQRFEVEVSLNPPLNGPWQFHPVGSNWLTEVQGYELQHLVSALEAKAVSVLAVRPIRTSLEDVFFSYISQSSDD
jgi:ABC-2 type transport system ATP-binding protein